MRFLVTNDDGFGAAGLAALRAAVRSLGEVAVVAPRDGISCGGHGVTDKDPIRIEQTPDGVFVVDALPADCVRLALTVLRDEIGPVDWVVAGINQGANLGVDVYYSGTVAAAREAAILGTSAVAVSQCVRESVRLDWQRAQEWAGLVVGQLVGRTGERVRLWNVNLPAIEAGVEPAGVAVCPASYDPLPVAYEELACQKRGCGTERRVRCVQDYWKRAARRGTDVERAIAGWITATPLRVDATGELEQAGEIGLKQ